MDERFMRLVEVYMKYNNNPNHSIRSDPYNEELLELMIRAYGLRLGPASIAVMVMDTSLPDQLRIDSGKLMVRYIGLPFTPPELRLRYEHVYCDTRFPEEVRFEAGKIEIDGIIRFGALEYIFQLATDEKALKSVRDLAVRNFDAVALRKIKECDKYVSNPVGWADHYMDYARVLANISKDMRFSPSVRETAASMLIEKLPSTARQLGVAKAATGETVDLPAFSKRPVPTAETSAQRLKR